jgi:hypothetical protein
MERNNERNSTFTEAQTCTMDMTDEEIQESYFGLHDKPHSDRVKYSLEFNEVVDHD